jgi:predicted alpha/beta-fold hydrolase
VRPFKTTTFRPAWWLPGAHLQTLGARGLRSKSAPPVTRHRLELPDGDFVDLDFFGADTSPNSSASPLVLLLHGLEGSARSGYVLELSRCLREVGIDSAGLNFRSCSGELNRLPRMYHSGETHDLEFTLNWLRDRAPERRLGAVGISLGGNALLKFLGTARSDAQRLIGAAVAISIPFDLSAGATELERVRGKLYSSYLLRKLRSKLRAKRTMMPSSVDMPQALAARTFREFDGRVTAPLHGFDDAEDYYRQSSSARYLADIDLPTLLIHAADDPFLPETFVPRAAVSENRQLIGAFPERGGHIGFVETRGFFKPHFWAEAEAARFLVSQLAPRPESA